MLEKRYDLFSLGKSLWYPKGIIMLDVFNRQTACQHKDCYFDEHETIVYMGS